MGGGKYLGATGYKIVEKAMGYGDGGEGRLYRFQAIHSLRTGTIYKSLI